MPNTHQNAEGNSLQFFPQVFRVFQRVTHYLAFVTIHALYATRPGA
jgi:hypothetical protein